MGVSKYKKSLTAGSFKALRRTILLYSFLLLHSIPLLSINNFSHFLRSCWTYIAYHCTRMTFSIKNFFSKCDQIRRKLQIWSHLLKKSLMKNVIFCAVCDTFLDVRFDIIQCERFIFSCCTLSALSYVLQFELC